MRSNIFVFPISGGIGIPFNVMVVDSFRSLRELAYTFGPQASLALAQSTQS